MSATLSINQVLPQRRADFSTLSEALDYAAEGQTGVNFYDSRCRLLSGLPYSSLRFQARALARSLLSLGLARGDRVAVIADTGADFLHTFFACQYAGLVPVPLPVPPALGNKSVYLQRLSRLIAQCGSTVLMAPDAMVDSVRAAAHGLQFIGSVSELLARPSMPVELVASGADDVAYLQYTSGSTTFPRGVVVTQQAVMANLRAIVGSAGLDLRVGDRATSWLPYYHDMGLVGFVLGPMAAQISVDYLSTQSFAMRPRQWLTLMSRNHATISYAPPFGYELCARRVREDEVARFDLSRWRIAGTGAEPIRPDILHRFADLLAPAGFDRHAFFPSYGLAEATLAVCFPRHGSGIQVETVDRQQLESEGEARRCEEDGTTRCSTLVNCGRVLPGHQLVIRDAEDRPLADGQVGRITVYGPSLMSGYFADPEHTRRSLSASGWLDTGDLGYTRDGELFITGRSKELIIINGRNIWPQDIEHLAESVDGVRSGDTIAFGADSERDQRVILQVECRLQDDAARAALVTRLGNLVQSDFAIPCEVDLVPPQSLPRTSSGKRSRAEAQRRYLQHRATEQAAPHIADVQHAS